MVGVKLDVWSLFSDKKSADINAFIIHCIVDIQASPSVNLKKMV
jgi:hypothetical protein